MIDDPLQNELDIMRDVSGRLEGAGIAYMLTGSMAMNYYAHPRMTRDIDIVVALTPAETDRVVALFEADYYVSREAVRNSIAQESIFNLIHNESVIKVDCIIRKNTPYRQTEFERRARIAVRIFLFGSPARKILLFQNWPGRRIRVPKRNWAT